jgi:hypothetical protein
MATTTKSILEQFLDQFEHWMSHAEFGDVGEQLHAPFKTTDE